MFLHLPPVACVRFYYEKFDERRQAQELQRREAAIAQLPITEFSADAQETR